MAAGPGGVPDDPRVEPAVHGDLGAQLHVLRAPVVRGGGAARPRSAARPGATAAGSAEAGAHGLHRRAAVARVEHQRLDVAFQQDRPVHVGLDVVVERVRPVGLGQRDQRRGGVRDTEVGGLPEAVRVAERAARERLAASRKCAEPNRGAAPSGPRRKCSAP